MTETIDTNSLLKLSGGDEEFVKEILSLFIERTPSELKKAKTFYKEAKTEELTEVIHKLKSFTTPLGLMQLQAKLSGLEKVVKTNELASFSFELEQVLLNIEEIIGRAKSQLDELKSE
jgi:HPt (histidine-containing phosphotransfer) domain-containing protein